MVKVIAIEPGHDGLQCRRRGEEFEWSGPGVLPWARPVAGEWPAEQGEDKRAALTREAAALGLEVKDEWPVNVLALQVARARKKAAEASGPAHVPPDAEGSPGVEKDQVEQ